MRAICVILLLLCAHEIAAAEPPMPPSPIAEFRGWLNQSPEQRMVALANRTPKSRAVIEQKIADYMALPPLERELKLSATEFQWYLKPLLRMEPGPERNAAVQRVVPLWQPMIMQRLDDWDKVSPALKKAALTHQLVVEYLSTPAHRQQAVLQSLTAEERAGLMERLGRWEILPATARARMDDRLREFFELEPKKQQEALHNFSAEERKSMEATLQSFRALSQEQRTLCINSFAQFAGKFAAMTDSEKLAFLKNVDRWREMSQAERDTWRQVVAVVPPMPPLPIPAPPMPGPPLPSPARK